MAKFELSIYGKDDEIVNTYTAEHVSWGLFIKAAELEESLKDKPVSNYMNAIEDLLKEVFVGLTSEELRHADAMDVMNTFTQVVSGGQKIKGGNSKNA